MQVESVKFPFGEGWGLTTKDDQLVATTGTSSMYFLNPDTLYAKRRITVHDNGIEVKNLNEVTVSLLVFL